MQNSAKLIPEPDNYRTDREILRRVIYALDPCEPGIGHVLPDQGQGTRYTRGQIVNPAHWTVGSSVCLVNAGDLFRLHTAEPVAH